jgi:parallel beta-helix repeat protein
MVSLTIPAVAVAVIIFALVSWNLLLPFSSQNNADFMNLAKYFIQDQYKSNPSLQQIVDSQSAGPIKDSIIDKIIANDNANFGSLGPRAIAEEYTNPGHVTLTFYVQYGNQENLLDLIDLLRSYDLKKAVFFVEKSFADDRPLLVEAMKQNGYTVSTWQNLTEYSREYPPSVYRGIALTDKAILSNTQRDSNAAAFLDVAVHYHDASIVAFTPKVMSHKLLLEEVLKQNGKTLIFADSNEASTVTPNIYSIQPEGMIGAEEREGQSGYYSDPVLGIVDITNDEKHSPLRLTVGDWGVRQLQRNYPYVIAPLPEKGNNAYLLLNSILIDRKASLTLDHVSLYLQSSSQKDSIPVTIEVRGKALIKDSLIASWDPVRQQEDIDGFHPRPFLVAKNGGILNVHDSVVSHLGYSPGGLKDSSHAIAAISYYDTNNFEIINSKLAFNFHAIYSERASSFSIIGNEMHGNTGDAINAHAGSRNFIVDSNYIHDNGNQAVLCSVQCSDITVSNNLVEYNGEGIGLNWLTNSSIIKDNVIQFNTKYGIFVQESCYINTIEGNIVMSNGKGIGLLLGSKENTLLNNVVMDNIQGNIIIDQDSDQSNRLENTKDTLADSNGLNERIKLIHDKFAANTEGGN